MRRWLIYGGLGICLGVVGFGCGRDDEAKAPQDRSATVERTSLTPPERAKEQTLEERLEQLSGTSWALELRRTGAVVASLYEDTVTFEGRRVTSERFSQLGYPGSNCSFTAQDDGTLIWETMQTNEAGEGVIFWRGEIRGEQMSGVLSQQPTTGDAENFAFTGSMVAATPAAPAATAPEKTTSSELPKP